VILRTREANRFADWVDGVLLADSRDRMGYAIE
jgi:hypothetical protein